jgi:hypothetical protein
VAPSNAHGEICLPMTDTCFRVPLCLAALLSLLVAGGCRDEPTAPKQARETNNVYGRNEAIRAAYAENVARSSKADRFAPLSARRPEDAARAPAEDRTLQTASVVPLPKAVAAPRQARTTLVAFASAPFPYHGKIARTDETFINVVENGRRGHRTPFNRVYWEDETYSDPRVLLHIPRTFDAKKPGVIVLFFHGHGAMLERDVMHRQQVPRQISEAGVNAVLVAPQLAVDARDSSPGKFWERGGVKRFLGEAAQQLAKLANDPWSEAAFAKMPVVIVAYSGGYLPAAWAISTGGLGKRLKGVVLLDALYGELDTFSNWVTTQRAGFFVSAYANSTRSRNETFEKLLAGLNLPVTEELGKALHPGSVVFLPTDEDTGHRDFVTKAWAKDPIKDVLQHIGAGGHKLL